MEISIEIMKYIESCYTWDEDIKQDVYVKILEAEEGTEINKGWCVKVHDNLASNTRRDEENRARLRKDNHETIVTNMGLNDQGSDPAAVVDAEESILIHFNSLSAVLRTTLIQHYVMGMTPEDITKETGDNVEAVRKRITRARNLLKGDTNDG